MDTVGMLQSLVKALEAGSYNVAPSQLVQGAALQMEDLSPVMHNVTFDDSDIKLQKVFPVVGAKGQLVQFDRQLSYGIFGGSAQVEGAVGQEETSDFVRAVVPMAYYSHIRRVSIAANMVQTVDGIKAEDRAAADAARKIAGDIEFDIFRGKADFSNAGVFDANPLTIAELPNMLGLEPQIRQSDALSNTRDLMFAEYGSDRSVVIVAGSTLTQSLIEDAHVRSVMNMGKADKLYVDPLVLSAYNKIAHNKEMIWLAQSAGLDVTGADLRKQFASGGPVQIEASRFLAAKTHPARPRASAPGAPTIALAQAGSGTSFLLNEVYQYYVTAVNEQGESAASASASITIGANGRYVTVTITPTTGTARYFNVYRTVAGGAVANAFFIGRVAYQGAATEVFTDLNNRLPGFVTGYLLDLSTAGIHELAPYSRLKLAVSDLSIPEASFRFACLACYQPRKNVLIDNLIGSI